MNFSNGIYTKSALVPANRSRIGSDIVPEAIVIHTTDTLPGTTAAIVRSWSTTAGQFDCAHFIIDRNGVITQMVNIFHNANHAGGHIHGWWKDPHGNLIHPNSMSVGIELESGGRLGRQVNGQWVHPDTKHVFAAADVFVDSHGIGWHAPNDAQLTALGGLLDDLVPELKPMPVGTTVMPDGDYAQNGVAYFAPVAGLPVIVLHATLDPVNKTDSGPVVATWLQNRLTQP